MASQERVVVLAVHVVVVVPSAVVNTFCSVREGVQPQLALTQKVHIFPVHLVKEAHQAILQVQPPAQVRAAHNHLQSFLVLVALL